MSAASPLRKRLVGITAAGIETSLMENTTAELSLPDILRFYTPLAATSVLMMVTHSIVSGATARTAAPAIALAGHSAAVSVGQLFEAPCYGLQRMALTFTSGEKSFGLVRRTSLWLVSGLVAGLLALSWTPFSKTVLMGVLGLTEEVYRAAVLSLRVCIVWPVSSALRSLYQSVIVLQKRTVWMTANMFVRVGVMLLAAWVLPRMWPQGPVGATILMLGLTTEAVLAFLVTKRALKPLALENDDSSLPTPRQIASFAMPLAVAASLQTLANPTIAAALSRTASPEITLSGYQVATSFSYIFAALTYNIYHAVVIYVRDARTYRKIRAFSFSLGAAGSAALLICNVPIVGAWVFGKLLGTTPDITGQAMATLRMLTITPVLLAFTEFYGGLLMFTRHAVWVTASKLANVAVTSCSVLVLAKAFPSLGGALGALAIVSGAFIEVLIGYSMSRRFKECRAYSDETLQSEPQFASIE